MPKDHETEEYDNAIRNIMVLRNRTKNAALKHGNLERKTQAYRVSSKLNSVLSELRLQYYEYHDAIKISN